MVVSFWKRIVQLVCSPRAHFSYEWCAHRRAEWERFLQLHKNCQDLTFFSDQKRRNIETLEEKIYIYAQQIQRKWTFQTGWANSVFSKCLFWFWPFKNVSKCFFFSNNFPNLSNGNAISNVRKQILGVLEWPNIPAIPKLFASVHSRACELCAAAALRWDMCWLLLQRLAPRGPALSPWAVSHSMQKVSESQVLSYSHTCSSSFQLLCVSRESWRCTGSSTVHFTPDLFQFASDQTGPSQKLGVASCSFQPWPRYSPGVEMRVSTHSAHIEWPLHNLRKHWRGLCGDGGPLYGWKGPWILGKISHLMAFSDMKDFLNWS